MKREKFLVIGMGFFGQSVAKALSEDGGEVVVIDESAILVDQVKDDVALAVEGDATDVKVLAQLGAANMDAAIVCIGEQFESAVLATANLLDEKDRACVSSLGVQSPLAERAYWPPGETVIAGMIIFAQIYEEEDKKYLRIIARRWNMTPG